MAAAAAHAAPTVQPSASLKRATSIGAASLKAAQSLEGAPPPSLLAGGASLKRVLTTVLSLPRQPSLAAVPEAQAPREKPGAPQQVVGPYAPDPPLLMADKEFQFVPVPADVSWLVCRVCAVCALVIVVVRGNTDHAQASGIPSRHTAG
jgi:hypothetical protein